MLSEEKIHLPALSCTKEHAPIDLGSETYLTGQTMNTIPVFLCPSGLQGGPSSSQT